MSGIPRIAHLIDSLDISGGAEAQLIANLRFFDHSRISHELVLLREIADSRINEVPPEVPVFVLMGNAERVSRLNAFLRLKKLARHRQYDLIHAALPNAAVSARFLGLASKPTVVESLVNMSHEPVRTIDNPAVTPTKLRLHTYLDRVTMPGVDRFHAVSQAVADSWARTIRLDREKIDVIPRGVDRMRILAEVEGTENPRRAICSELGLDPDGSLIVVTIGRIEPQKGHRYLIEAAHILRDRLPQLRVVIVGRRGNASPRIEEMIAELGLDEIVVMPGSRQDFARFLGASDIFAFPSLFEGNGGNALIEAMVAGLPVITTGEPPMTDLVPDNRYGLLTPRADSDALAAAIASLAEDDNLRMSLGRAAQDRAASFPTPLEIASRYEDWYEGLLAT